MAARGLGKGLDSLIPNALGETKTKKEAVAKAKSEATTEEKEPQTLVRISMRMHYRNWRILSNSLVCCSRFWYRIVRIIMRLLPVREDGVQPSWQV